MHDGDSHLFIIDEAGPLDPEQRDESGAEWVAVARPLDESDQSRLVRDRRERGLQANAALLAGAIFPIYFEVKYGGVFETGLAPWLNWLLLPIAFVILAGLNFVGIIFIAVMFGKVPAIVRFLDMDDRPHLTRAAQQDTELRDAPDKQSP